MKRSSSWTVTRHSPWASRTTDRSRARSWQCLPCASDTIVSLGLNEAVAGGRKIGRSSPLSVTAPECKGARNAGFRAADSHGLLVGVCAQISRLCRCPGGGRFLTALARAWKVSGRGCIAGSGLVRHRSGLVLLCCTAAAACGYGTGVGESSAAAAGDVHGFPAVLTSFIGRDGPLREIAGLLEECRLVTVTGPGGAGKTRLASEVARRVAGRFADGAWLVELAPVRDPAQVAGVVAAALGVREQPGVPAAEAVARVLARQQLLLVLDNCEHVIGAAAQLCAGLLAACDDVRVLATSREPLAVAGEARYRLGPLTLPGPGEPG